MERRGAFFETVVVILAAVEIKGEFPQSSGVCLCQQKCAIAVPVGSIDRIAKDRAQHSGKRRARACSRIQSLRRLRNYRRALRAHRREDLWMCESEAQRSISAHRYSTNGAASPSGTNPVSALNFRQKFL